LVIIVSVVVVVVVVVVVAAAAAAAAAAEGRGRADSQAGGEIESVSEHTEGSRTLCGRGVIGTIRVDGFLCAHTSRTCMHTHMHKHTDGPDEGEDLADEGDGLLAQPVGVAHVGEDDLLPSLDARLRRRVELPAHRVLAALHHVGEAVVVEDLGGAVFWSARGGVGVRGVGG
jgi:hypothetical protein